MAEHQLALTHYVAHALYHTWRDGFYPCRRPAFAGYDQAEGQADLFAALLVGAGGDVTIDRLELVGASG
ncbi:MAG: hypothetical protein ACRDIY_11290 [Chloroflexota bacterium]